LSNTGGKEVTEKTLKAYHDLRDRNSITYDELEQLVQVRKQFVNIEKRYLEFFFHINKS